MQLFQLFDENHDGFIDPGELTHVMGLLGRKMSLRRATSIVKKNSRGARTDPMESACVRHYFFFKWSIP
jgi:Ca2+-binding EF-hand superfamily protein